VRSLGSGKIGLVSVANPGVSIIVPTFREAFNVTALIERTFAALRDFRLPVEMIVVDDDSQDGTDAVIQSLQARLSVRLIVRKGERGLSGAVLRGFQEARYDRFVVLDADLQHPPELIPRFVEKLDAGDCDFVIGTRYAPGGQIEGSWPWHRRVFSRAATLLARPLMPVSDPMSGFFALRRETWEQAANLNPIGYKIALELYVKCACRRPAEIPITFGLRQAGASKLSAGVAVRYLQHLLRLYRFRYL